MIEAGTHRNPLAQPGPAHPSGLVIQAPRAWLAVVIGILVIAFAKPLYELAAFTRSSDLYSHIPLIPLVSLYLVWAKRKDLHPGQPLSPKPAVFPLIAGFALLAGYWWVKTLGWKPQLENYLACMASSFLLLLTGSTCLFLGIANLRAVAFPAALLFFSVPFPEPIRVKIELFLQHGSAEAAYRLFILSGMPVYRQGLDFQLPGFSLQVARECSGIYSSLVLLITALVAGHLLLRTGKSKALLVILSIPLALLRNGFRIWVLGELCVNSNPNWIDSRFHHQGGPIFFVLSLVPLFFMIILLRHLESRGNQSRPEHISV